MRLSPIRKISEGAYFLVDFKTFTNTLTPYNPILANQTISFGYEILETGEIYEPIQEEGIQEEQEATS